MDNIVEVADLHFAYNKLEVLRGLSLEIPRGKVVAILGGSGCGKSTLLKLIGGQLRPAKGSVKVEGQDVHQLAPDALYRLRLGPAPRAIELHHHRRTFLHPHLVDAVLVAVEGKQAPVGTQPRARAGVEHEIRRQRCVGMRHCGIVNR